jgi:hypothetical protein
MTVAFVSAVNRSTNRIGRTVNSTRVASTYGSNACASSG